MADEKDSSTPPPASDHVPHHGTHLRTYPVAEPPATVRPAPSSAPTTAAAPTPPVRPARPAKLTPWQHLRSALVPRANRTQLVVGVLCALLGFALVVQVTQTNEQALGTATQEELVRLYDDVSARADDLESEVARLRAQRDELATGTDQAAAAADLAAQRAQTEGILSGRLPATGPGLRIRISDPSRVLQASQLFNVLEELRNAGAEAVEVNGIRLVTSSAFVDGTSGILVDDHLLSSPYSWTAIGDPDTLNPALEIPGGAMAKVRTAGAKATTEAMDSVTIDAVRIPSTPKFAIPTQDD